MTPAVHKHTDKERNTSLTQRFYLGVGRPTQWPVLELLLLPYTASAPPTTAHNTTVRKHSLFAHPLIHTYPLSLVDQPDDPVSRLQVVSTDRNKGKRNVVAAPYFWAKSTLCFRNASPAMCTVKFLCQSQTGHYGNQCCVKSTLELS